MQICRHDLDKQVAITRDNRRKQALLGVLEMLERLHQACQLQDLNRCPLNVSKKFPTSTLIRRMNITRIQTCQDYLGGRFASCSTSK